MATLLTKQQLNVLENISETRLSTEFYFSGGTALTHYYLQHRFSEDLDFFSENEFDPLQAFTTLKSIKNKIGYSNIDIQQSFNRNLFFLHFTQNTTLKLEFTFYPFKQIEAPTKKDGLLVDSVIDIATNKLFTIAQNPRGRDYFDLYHIINKYNFSLEKLRMLAKQKFDWHVDPLHLASRFFQVTEFLDDPIVTSTDSLANTKLVNFFQSQSQLFSTEILKT